MAKRKDKKAKKGKKRASKPRALPTAVKGLLQYLGGQDATLQQTRPRGAATGADGGDTLNRYLAAKTAALESMRQQAIGVNIAQQAEEKLLAKRQAEEAEKKIAMLSAGLKESDIEKKKSIEEQRRKIAELESVVRQQGVESLFQEMRRNPNPQLGSLPSQAPSYLGQPPSEPSFMRAPMSEYSVAEEQAQEELEMAMGSSAASELYRQNAPLDRPIIRDKPKGRAAGGGAAAPVQRLPKRIQSAPKAPEKSSTNISAAELKSRISEVTGLARSRYKLPSRGKYGGVQAALQNVSASSADIISALKEAGVNLMEA